MKNIKKLMLLFSLLCMQLIGASEKQIQSSHNRFKLPPLEKSSSPTCNQLSYSANPLVNTPRKNETDPIEKNVKSYPKNQNDDNGFHFDENAHGAVMLTMHAHQNEVSNSKPRLQPIVRK